MNIFVGNLSFDTVAADVKKLFEGFGNVASVAIVMRKEKKAPKSRGFGFVQMSDEQQALAAIATLNGKEFMGRVINVNPARPKTEAQAESELKEKRQSKVKAEAEQYPREEREQKKTLNYPVFNKPGTYKGGRRTHSYMKRRGLAGMQEEAKPRRKNQDNPMRWRKRKDQPRPWLKSSGEPKPWKKAEEGGRPWKKTEGEPKPWKKPQAESKPWKKSGGESRPWKKAEGESKPWRKSEGGFKPWRKPGEESKPWKKPAGEPKPWSKSSGRPQKPRFKGRRKPGGYKR